jgi:hypothetical protein
MKSVRRSPTRRSEFAAILRTDGIGGLIAALNRKADSLDSRAALRLMRKLFKKQGFAPKLLVTDNFGCRCCLDAKSRSCFPAVHTATAGAHKAPGHSAR